MESTIHKLRLVSYKAQQEAFRLESESLARRFGEQGLSDQERAKIGRRLDEVTVASSAHQFLIELMGWHARPRATH
jgi:hypothetical protein